MSGPRGRLLFVSLCVAAAAAVVALASGALTL